jgi:Lar family restriction alleviation protein
MAKITNGDKFITAEERITAFRKFCETHSCMDCPINNKNECRFTWLDLEYQAELKPCPFCGGTPVLADNVETTRSLTYYAKCSCGARFASALSKSAAIELWNRRGGEK